MKSKILAVLSALLVFVMLFSACGEKPQEELPENEVVEEKEPEPVYLSPLTGLPTAEENISRRPVAIMINNIKAALPQYGISKANIIFEALAEGGITRLLAVFEDVGDVEQIGTIRSARPYYLDFAQSVDAVYIHMGGSPDAYSQITSRGMDSFDLISGANNSMYWRDKERMQTKGYEHSVFTSGDRIEEKLASAGTRMTRKDGYGNVFNFSEEADYEGADATDISIVFSPYKTGTFTYDKENGFYRVGQYGTAHTDALFNSVLAFKNVFALRINSYVIKGDTAGRLAFDTVGEGTGKYFVHGTETDIKWSRASKSAPFKLYTLTGEELSVVPGDSYVAVVPLNAKISVTGEAPIEPSAE